MIVKRNKVDSKDMDVYVVNIYKYGISNMLLKTRDTEQT